MTSTPGGGCGRAKPPPPRRAGRAGSRAGAVLGWKVGEEELVALRGPLFDEGAVYFHPVKGDRGSAVGFEQGVLVIGRARAEEAGRIRADGFAGDHIRFELVERRAGADVEASQLAEGTGRSFGVDGDGLGAATRCGFLEVRGDPAGVGEEAQAVFSRDGGAEGSEADLGGLVAADDDGHRFFGALFGVGGMFGPRGSSAGSGRSGRRGRPSGWSCGCWG